MGARILANESRRAGGTYWEPTMLTSFVFALLLADPTPQQAEILKTFRG
jgi:hypothetical protein